MHRQHAIREKGFLMKKVMVNTDAIPVSRIPVRNVVEGFVRDPVNGRIYYLHRVGKERRAHSIFTDGTVHSAWQTLPEDMRIELLDPGDLGIEAGRITMCA